MVESLIHYPFVKHLPDDFTDVTEEHPDLIASGEEAFSGALYGELSSPVFIASLVASDIEIFEKTGDPYYAIRAWIGCMGNGLYPPPSILKWADKALHEYWKSEGKTDLHQLLGLKGTKGRPPLIASHNQKGEESSRAHAIHQLVEVFDVTIGDAAYMVKAREEDLKRECPSDSWLAENYSKKWRKELLQLPLEEFTEKARKIFINSFPEYSRPHGLK